MGSGVTFSMQMRALSVLKNFTLDLMQNKSSVRSRNNVLELKHRVFNRVRQFLSLYMQYVILVQFREGDQRNTTFPTKGGGLENKRMIDRWVIKDLLVIGKRNQTGDISSCPYLTIYAGDFVDALVVVDIVRRKWGIWIDFGIKEVVQLMPSAKLVRGPKVSFSPVLSFPHSHSFQQPKTPPKAVITLAFSVTKMDKDIEGEHREEEEVNMYWTDFGNEDGEGSAFVNR